MSVFLLTSHPVSPPWNSGDKHLARTLLLGGLGTDHYFLARAGDGATWPATAHPLKVTMRADIPTVGAKLRLLNALVGRMPRVDAVHSLVAYGRGRLTPLAVLALPVVRRSRLIVTCPTGWHLPQRLLRRADLVVALSAATAERLQAIGCRDVALIPPGVDVEAFQPAPPGPARAALGIPDVPTLLFSGHYLEGGGLEQALAVLARLRRHGDVRLLVAMRSVARSAHGKGGPAELRVQLAAAGLEDAVTVLGHDPDMGLAITAASALLFQPHQLNLKTELPITLLEGLACGRPVVVGTTPPLPEMDDGSGGLCVCATDDAEATAALLHGILHDPAEHAERGAAARRLAETRYTVARMAARYADAYAGLGLELDRPPPAAGQAPGSVETRPVSG